MEQLDLLGIKKMKFLFAYSILFGIVTGVINLAIIFIITHVDEVIKRGGDRLFILSFAGCGILYLGSNYFSLYSSAKLTNKIILDLRLRVQEYILNSDYHDIELIGNNALYSINNDDINKIERYADTLPRIIINIFTISLIIIYMFFLDWKETIIFILAAIGTFLVFALLQEKLKERYERSRKMMDRLMGNINSLISGIRELSVSAHLRKQFFLLDSVPTLTAYHEQQISKSKYEQLSISWFWISFYAIIAISVIILQDQHIEHKMKFVIPLLMIFGPMTMIMSMISVFYSAKVAMDKIRGLQIKKSIVVGKNIAEFKSAKMSALEYVYHNADNEKGFTVGPFNFTLEPGKVIFVIGGNGSGKSTLTRLITCLYKQTSGEIIVNGKAIIDRVDTLRYQSYWGVIYQTPHIFSMVLAIDLAKKKDELSRYLELFELKDKIELNGNTFMNVEKLSYGQKKRLGLMLALLEDKPIYLFDEWAADQDPHFRKMFYVTILPELKSRGKAIIAVTHDDEYFDMADELIKLRSGQQVSV